MDFDIDGCANAPTQTALPAREFLIEKQCCD